MRDSTVIIVSALLLVVWVILRVIPSYAGDNAGIALQLIGTLLGIAVIALLVIRSFQIIRRRTTTRA